MMFIVLLLCFVGSIWHCDDLVGEERVGSLHFFGLYRVYCPSLFVCGALWCSGKWCAVVQRQGFGSRSRASQLARAAPASTICCVLAQDTLFTYLSTGFYLGRPARNTQKMKVSLSRKKVYSRCHW